MSDDDDKTVFGQPLPPPKPAAKPASPAPQPASMPRPAPMPAASPPPPQQPMPAPDAPRLPTPSGDADRTVFGQQLPVPGQDPGRVAPVAPQPPAPPPAPPNPPVQDAWNNPGQDDTWLGGALNPQPTPPAPPPAGAAPLQQPPSGHTWAAVPLPPQPVNPQPAPPPPVSPAPPPPQPPKQQPVYAPETAQRPAGSEIFPEFKKEPVAQPTHHNQPKIALQDALKGSGLGAGGSSNPLVAAAANLLILLGRLRTGLVEMQPEPLIQHVYHELDLFERNALEAGVNPQDATDAKYALAATADDIVQNLPGANRGVWLEYSMVAQFFGERSSGVGFFQKMDAAMKAPGQRFHLLELMLTCLSLGFEGQYRAMPNGSVELARIRTAIYETLRRVSPRPDEDVSVAWTPVTMGRRRRRAGVPLWAVAGVASMMILAMFATLSTLLSGESVEAETRILSLHDRSIPIAIERTAPVEKAYQAPESNQLERLREALAQQIDAGEVEVERNNEWVFVRVGNILRFRPASAELKNDFTPVATAIGTALNSEQGPIRVVGHTDSDRLSGRGRYKTNEQLSLARAQTVADILGPVLTDASRISVEGMGAVNPIAENTSREGKARNRRVEIMIPREE